MKSIKLSIIIPAYNVEKYIDKCIKSIEFKRSDIEIIIIDDGSTDSTLDVIEKCVKGFQNVKVKHIVNGGQARARNIGISEANGEYIMFMDSDDYLSDSSFIERILQLIKRKPDMIIYGYKKYWEGTRLLIEKKKLKNEECSLEYLIKTNYFKGCPWDKILKKRIIEKNKMNFPEGILSEDIDWCAQIINNIDMNKIIVLNENPYIYVQHKGSTSKKVKAKHVSDVLSIILKYIPDKKVSNRLLLEYFSYEYCMMLGVINSSYCEGVDKEIIKSFYDYKWLLKYSKCRKVKICFYLSKILGVKMISVLLGKYVDYKKRGL